MRNSALLANDNDTQKFQWRPAKIWNFFIHWIYRHLIYHGTMEWCHSLLSINWLFVSITYRIDLYRYDSNNCKLKFPTSNIGHAYNNHVCDRDHMCTFFRDRYVRRHHNTIIIIMIVTIVNSKKSNINKRKLLDRILSVAANRSSWQPTVLKFWPRRQFVHQLDYLYYHETNNHYHRHEYHACMHDMDIVLVGTKFHEICLVIWNDTHHFNKGQQF